MQVSNQYWAGLFDGEGCVIPEKYFSKTHSEKFIVGVKVALVQKERMVLYLLQKKFGGFIHIRKNGIGQWGCGKAIEVIAFLEAIKPYAIIKAVEIVIALELLDAIVKPRTTSFQKDRQGRKWIRGKPPISLEEIKRRQLLESKFVADRADSKITESQNN